MGLRGLERGSGLDHQKRMKAMVLSAGYGSRLGKLTSEIPKPMLPLGGRPILSHIISHLQTHGFDRIAINLHFMPETIRNYFGDGAKWKVNLNYSVEPQLLGTAGGVKNVEKFLRDGEAFLVHYGDILTDQDFSAMLQFHRERKALVTLLMHERARSNSVIVMDRERRIVNFLERPSDEERRGVESPWVNSGIAICSPELLDHIPAGVPADLPRDVYPKLMAGGRLFGFPLSGYRCAIDSPERLAEAESALKEGRCKSTPNSF
jgi:NDP-sugar pyrophosphorylase family protein